MRAMANYENTQKAVILRMCKSKTFVRVTAFYRFKSDDFSLK